MSDRDFDDLVNAWLDGTTDAAELARLEQHLLEHAESQAEFWELASLHGLVYTLAKQERFRPLSSPPDGASAAESPRRLEEARSDSPALGFLGTAVNLSVAWLSSPKALALTVAGGLLTYFVVLVISIAVSRNPASDRDSKNVAQNSAAPRTRNQGSLAKNGTGVGSLTAGDRARWSKKSSPPTDGAIRIGQRYELLSGRVDVALSRGAQVAIDGPATWLLETNQRLQLDSGKLTARVPKSAIGFTVATPLAEVVDLGTEFGVQVDGSGKTEIHVLQGEVEVKEVSTVPTKFAGTTKVVAGQAVRVSAAGERLIHIPVDRRTFTSLNTLARSGAARLPSDDSSQTEIWLGNLFDDSRDTSLAEAMETDTFGATPDVGDLGIERVQYGGAALQEIAPEVRFDLGALGWQDLKAYTAENDSIGGFPISTLGQQSIASEPLKVEEGIGGHANFLITFDLDKIRAAGALAGRRFQFISERAGVSTHVRGNTDSSVHLAVIVSGRDGVQAICVDGNPIRVAREAKVWSIGSTVGDPLRADGEFVRFRVAVPAEAKYLTLVATSAGNGHSMDGVVWAGARLEVR